MDTDNCLSSSMQNRKGANLKEISQKNCILKEFLLYSLEA
jgi:hypothetical protein